MPYRQAKTFYNISPGACLDCRKREVNHGKDTATFVPKPTSASRSAVT